MLLRMAVDQSILSGSMKPSRSEGLFYLLFFPRRGWIVISYPYWQYSETTHPAWWEDEVARGLGRVWSKTLGSEVDTLRGKFLPLWEAFPRGRVVKTPGGYQVRAVEFDQPPFSADLRAAIQLLFGLPDRVTWTAANEYAVNPEHRAAMDRILGAAGPVLQAGRFGFTGFSSRDK